MTTLRLRLRHAFAAALAVCLLALGATDAHATHFRYGTLRWELLSETPTSAVIKITSESAWRFGYPWGATPTIGVPLNTGQTLTVQRTVDNGGVFSTPLMVTPSSINGTEDWFVGSSQNTITFLKTNLPVRIFWQGNARISSLQDGNNDQPFRVESIMSATPNAASPAASILPIITLAYPLPAAHFFIPAADVEGDTLTWSISLLARSLLVKAAPDGSDDIPPPTLSINSATGEVTWATNEELPPTPGGHFYAVQFLVTDSKGAQTPVDALLRLRTGAGTAPEARINGSTNQYLVSVRPNNLVSFTLSGVDVDPGATVTLTSGALPPGSTMTPSLPTSGTGAPPAGTSSVFNWTPTLAQAGNVFVVSFAVTDNLGQQATNSAQITVLENFAPTVTCPVPVTVEATGPSGASATIEATVDDPDGDALTVKWFVDGTLVETDTVPAGAGSTVVSLTHSYGFLPAPLHAIRVEVDDGQLTRECTTSVEVVDTTPPVISNMPLDMVLEATGPDGAVATWPSPTALDLVDGVRPVVCTPASGSTFPLGTTTVSCSASDTRGNTATETFTVTVQDTTPPVISNMPADMLLEATGPSGAPASWPPPTAVDIVDGSVPVICAPPSGSTFPLDATTTVTCTATDSHGNSSARTFTVRVQDTTPPVISNMPANMVVPSTGPGGAIVTWPPPTAVDIVDGNVPVTCVPPSGSLFPLGTTTVTCTARDAHNNASSRSFTVTVRDLTPPTVTVTLNPGVLWPPNHKMVKINVTATTNEPGSTCSIVSVTSNEPVEGRGDGNTPFDWLFSGMSLQLRAERSGLGNGRIYTVTVRCVDPAGNAGTGTATAIVPHDMGGSTGPGVRN